MKAIFITSEDIKRYSILDGNVDNDKFNQFVEIAQDIHVQEYLGTDLYDKIQALILDGSIENAGNVKYKTLLEDYIKPMHIRWSSVEFMPYLAYTISNGGIYKHVSETSESVNVSEVNLLTERSRSTAEFYTRRLISFLCTNSTDYPEYQTNSNGDISPNKNSNYTGWVL
tara:strand:- start:53 stop:562 length:510 start_codon:yes stop_codon:yes gene_type:complete